MLWIPLLQNFVEHQNPFNFLSLSFCWNLSELILKSSSFCPPKAWFWCSTVVHVIWNPQAVLSTHANDISDYIPLRTWWMFEIIIKLYLELFTLWLRQSCCGICPHISVLNFISCIRLMIVVLFLICWLVGLHLRQCLVII